VWERFKELKHGILDWLLVQTFYKGLQQSMKISIDAATRGAVIAKPINEAQQLFEDMVSNNYNWGSERGQPNRRGRHEIDAFTMLANKVDALFQKVDYLQPTPSQSGAQNYVHSQVNICEMCGVQGHIMSECHLAHLPQDLTIEQANDLHNFNARPRNDPYSTTYNLEWRNHPIFFYKTPNPTPHHPS